MPKVTIAEKDLTSAEAIQYDDHIVLIPGTTLVKDVNVGQEKYFTDEVAFKDALTEVNSSWDTNTKMVYRLLELGMTVLYRVIASKSELETEAFWAKYADKSLYNLRFLTCGDLISTRAAEQMIKCAAERGDAIALVDIPTEPVAIDLSLVGILTSGTVSVDEGAFVDSNLIITKVFQSGSYEETEVASENTTFAFSPTEPESEVGEHSVIVTGYYTDAGGALWESPEVVMQYTIGEN